MKAVVIRSYGGPEVAHLEQVDAPTVRANDLLIDVRATSLNPIDFKIRQGQLRMVRPKLPLPITLGCDVAGVVRAVGPGARGFAVGDEIFARLEKDRLGGLAEQVAVDAGVVAKKPAHTRFDEAASVPLAGLTALQALREAAALTEGQRVLIHAGAGGVGSLAIQIAKAMGLWVATTTSTKNVDFLRGLGADEVIDYTKGPAPLRELDAVFDTLGEASEIASIAMVKRGGTVVGIGGRPDDAFARVSLPAFARPVLALMNRKRTRAAARAGVRYVYLFMRPDGAQLAELAAWIEAGKLKPILHATYTLAQFADAFAELERGRARGKIVVTI